MHKNSIKIFTIPIVCFLVLTGCTEEVVAPQIQENIIGTWALRSQSGSAPAICEGEILQFDNDGIAVSQCPEKQQVVVPYTAANNVLTFTETNVQYNIEKPSDTNLVLTGINVDRILKYGNQF